MREVTHGDIRAAARALLGQPAECWPILLQGFLTEAHIADCYRKRWGRAHPRLGNGTLMSVALARHPVAEPVASDRVYLAALAAVIAGVFDWKTRNNAEKNRAVE